MAMESAVLSFTLMAAAVLCGSRTVHVEPCPSYDVLEKIVYLPHPYNCSLFRRCQAGEPVLGHCPLGQHFNPADAVCDDPAGAGCMSTPYPCSAGAPLSTCRYKCACSRKEDDVTCPAKLEFSPLLDVFGWTKNSSCVREPGDVSMGTKKLGHVVTTNVVARVSLCPGGKQPGGSLDYRHFADCTKMVRCDGSAEAVLQCLPGLVYDADLGYCDDPANVDCGADELAPPGGCPTARPLSSCPYSCECEMSHGKCPAQMKFDATINITDSATHPACLADPSLISIGGGYLGSLEVDSKTAVFNYCPASSSRHSVYVPDTLECGRMIRCYKGKGRPFFCPKGYLFDLRHNSCKRNKTICQDDGSPAGPPKLDKSVAVDLPCPSSGTCPTHDGGRLAHLTDCTLFCECQQGASKLGVCPPGLHFSQQAQACDLPENAKCHTFCSKLPAVSGGSWDRAECVAGDSPEGAACRLYCDSNFQLVGSDVISCTSRGWHGSGGLNQLPSCNTVEQVAQIIISRINKTMTAIKAMDQKAAMLFVLDESGSVGSQDFEIEKNFVEALVTAFPLSQNRSSGVITFNGVGDVAVDISLRQTSTCDFLSELRAIVYSGGLTDLSGALVLAKDEIDLSATSGQNSSTLVFAITDGLSQTDPAEAAKLLRDSGHTVFTIGVANYDRKQLEPLSSTYKDGSKLFFGLPNFQVFNVVAEYLRTTYKNNATQTCT